MAKLLSGLRIVIPTAEDGGVECTCVSMTPKTPRTPSKQRLSHVPPPPHQQHSHRKSHRNVSVLSKTDNLFVKYGSIITSVHAVDGTLVAIIEQLLKVVDTIFQVDFLCILYRNFERKRYFVHMNTTHASFELDPDAGSNVLGVGIVRQCMSSKSLVHIQNYHQKHLLYSRFEAELGLESSDVMCVPVLLIDEPIGAILCGFGAENECGGSEEIMSLIASSASIALSSQHSAQVASIFLAAASERSSSLSLAVLIDHFIDAVEKLTNGSTATIYYCDRAHDEMWYVSSRKGYHGSYDKDVVSRVAQTAQPFRLNDCPTKQNQDGYAMNVNTVLSVPILCAYEHDSSTIAVLHVINKPYHAKFTAEDEAVLVRFAAEISKTFQKRILDERALSLTNKEKAQYLAEGFQREFGVGYTKSSFKIVRLSSNVSSNDVNINGFSANSPNAKSRASLTCVTSHIDDWSFNPFRHKDHPAALLEYIVAVFNQFNLLDEFNVNETIFMNFLKKVHISEAMASLTTIDIFALFIAALCHDLDHPGNTNMFECKNKSEWALTHSFESVLEKHHASQTHKLLNNPETDILAGLDEAGRSWVTNMITRAILGTDMSLHRWLLDRMELRIAQGEPLKYADEAQHRVLRTDLVCYILHCADLGAQTQTLDVAAEWSKRVHDEFYQQVEKERELGLPLTDHMVGLDKEEKRCKSQVVFIATFVLPIWRALSRLFPSLDEVLVTAVENEKHYQSRYQDLISVCSCPAESKL